MNARIASVAPGLSPGGDASVLCVHFAADGREHSMWYLDPEETGVPALTGFTAGLASEWSVSAGGVARAVVLRGDRNVLCEGLLLLTTETDQSSMGTLGGTLGSLFSWDSRRRDNNLLRAEGVPSYPASMISGIRHRPLLATFARGVDLPVPLARHVHGLLLRTAPRDARCPACGGAGYVRGEPCLACA
jgi:hypothetical protein